MLDLRIVGDGVPPFEVRYRTDKDSAFRVGAQFHAVVDPADNLFTLQNVEAEVCGGRRSW